MIVCVPMCFAIHYTENSLKLYTHRMISAKIYLNLATAVQKLSTAKHFVFHLHSISVLCAVLWQSHTIQIPSRQEKSSLNKPIFQRRKSNPKSNRYIIWLRWFAQYFWIFTQQFTIFNKVLRSILRPIIYMLWEQVLPSYYIIVTWIEKINRFSWENPLLISHVN